MLLLCATALPSIYYFRKYQTTKQQLQETTLSEVERLIQRVGKHIQLPTNETPTIMTIADKEKLSDQLFFTHAVNGDKVLLYEKAKKAFLYSVAKDIVLEVGPVTFQAPTATPGATPITPTTIP